MDSVYITIKPIKDKHSDKGFMLKCMGKDVPFADKTHMGKVIKGCKSSAYETILKSKEVNQIECEWTNDKKQHRKQTRC